MLFKILLFNHLHPSYTTLHRLYSLAPHLIENLGSHIRMRIYFAYWSFFAEVKVNVDSGGKECFLRPLCTLRGVRLCRLHHLLYSFSSATFISSPLPWHHFDPVPRVFLADAELRHDICRGWDFLCCPTLSLILQHRFVLWHLPSHEQSSDAAVFAVAWYQHQKIPCESEDTTSANSGHAT